MNLISKAALIGASLTLVTGCTWVDRTFNTNFTGGTPSERASVAEKTPAAAPGAAAKEPQVTYEQQEITNTVAEFFGIGAEAAGEVVARAFADNGEPVGYIRGEEVSAAAGVGVRYGEGTLSMKNGQSRKVFWQGPSIGFDGGANASKVLTLVYGLNDADTLYQRFPGVNGSAYFIGGVGVSYARADNITLAPMRAGVGLRAGVNVGYIAISRERNVIPL
ncbi:MAG: DUF1134 domain-containing protein [Hyphomonadaceae bacterium]|nr:DUF1134 domain-containing protein [Hyphomonadaceae bacterium]